MDTIDPLTRLITWFVRLGCSRSLLALCRLEEGTAVRFIKFCCVGAANCLVDFLVYLGLLYLMPVYAARTLAWVAACLFSYLVNRRWTFRAGDTGLLPLLRFAVVNICTLGLGLALLYVFIRLGCGEVVAFFLCLPFTLTANFLGYRFWSFRDIGR